MLDRLKNSPIVRTAIALGERYGRDNGQNMAGAIAFFGFLSLFPLILLGISVVGFVLAGDPSLEEKWIAEIRTAVPGLEAIAEGNLTKVREFRGLTGIVAFGGLLWTGRAVVASAEMGLGRIFGVRPKESFFREHGRRLATTVGLGVLALGGTAVTSLAGLFDPAGAAGVAVAIVAVLLGLVLDFGLFIVTYRVLILRPGPPWRALWPGALFVAVGWTVLKLAGGWYASRTVGNAKSIYGPFAATVGVLVLLYLAGRLFVYGAELIAVLREGNEQPGGGGSVDRQTEGPASDRAAPGQRSTVGLVTQVAGDVGTLVRKEIELAKQEITEGITARVKGIAAFAVVGVLGLFALGFMAAAGASALDNVLRPWASRLVVAGAFLLIAAIAAMFGVRRMKRPPLAPVKTKETIKEDVEWAKAQLKR